eukprot:10776245-Lingulodinium_polyedra.AAC.1
MVPAVARGANCEYLFVDHSLLWAALKADAERGHVEPFHNLDPVRDDLGHRAGPGSWAGRPRRP